MYILLLLLLLLVVVVVVGLKKVHNWLSVKILFISVREEDKEWDCIDDFVKSDWLPSSIHSLNIMSNTEEEVAILQIMHNLLNNQGKNWIIPYNRRGYSWIRPMDNSVGDCSRGVEIKAYSNPFICGSDWNEERREVTSERARWEGVMEKADP